MRKRDNPSDKTPGLAKKFVFVFGGARSGKSAFALKLSEGLAGKRVYVATATPGDEEMRERIRLHKEAREGRGGRGGEGGAGSGGWVTIEEPLKVAEVVSRSNGKGVILIDCLTLWINNLMEAGLKDKKIFDEAGSLSSVCLGSDSDVIAVSNEVGFSIVPQNRLARRFADLSGRVNQIFAREAHEVYLVAAGIPVRIK